MTAAHDCSMIIHLLVMNVWISDELKRPFTCNSTEYSYSVHGSKPSTNMLIGFSDTGFSSVTCSFPPSLGKYLILHFNAVSGWVSSRSSLQEIMADVDVTLFASTWVGTINKLEHVMANFNFAERMPTFACYIQ